MPFTNEEQAITYVFESIARTDWRNRGLDEDTRDVTPTRRLLAAVGVPRRKREYAVITGSKGKGSVAAITAKLLHSLGHTAGLLTSPHLTTYRQRFRVNGRMISEADLVRLVNELAPSIDEVQAGLEPTQYLSPQGIFLALALKWFDEQEVTAAVIEVGRGGRYDDNALVPNMLSMFTPIIMEHARYLGNTLERIAWHKAGIIKPNSYAYSLPQEPPVMEVLRAEADTAGATFEWLAPADTGHLIAEVEDGQVVDMGRYGQVRLPLLGRYEIANASLAVWGAGNMHARLTPPVGTAEIPHSAPEYVQRIRAGLETVVWPGRCQQLQGDPAVYVDGAINPVSAGSYIESVRSRLREPVITVLAVPRDRQYEAVYQRFAPISQALILTESARNIAIFFPDAATAVETARRHHDDVTHAPTIRAALDLALQRAGSEGTVLICAAQPAIGDVMEVYGLEFEQI
jgi:dihydrofolate synthase / folylpolyglutamate synthase